VPTGVGDAQQRGGELGQGAVVESGGEPQRSGQDGHDARVTEAQRGRVHALGSGGLVTSAKVTVSGADGRLRLQRPQTLVGVFASGPQGVPVLRADAPTDPAFRVLQITVSVRSARCALKYCLIRVALK
jgi:hypothetical protein